MDILPDIPPNNDYDDCMYDDYDEYGKRYDSEDIESLLERSVCCSIPRCMNFICGS